MPWDESDPAPGQINLLVVVNEARPPLTSVSLQQRWGEVKVEGGRAKEKKRRVEFVDFAERRGGVGGFTVVYCGQ